MSILHLSVSITLSFVLSFFAQPAEIFSNKSEQIATEIENKIQSLVEKGKLPSLQAVVISRDRLVWSNEFGTGSGKDFIYMIGSIQKVFTATAVLQLHEKGLLRIDNDINSYLPFTVRNPKYPEISITIFMLLSHRSGLEMFKNQAEWDMRFLT